MRLLFECIGRPLIFSRLSSNKKKQKNHEDANFIYEKLRQFHSFEGFFNRNLKTFDHQTILSLCQTFEYEQIPQGNCIFQKGDNAEKCYLILSGEVSATSLDSEGRWPKGRKSKKKTNYSKPLSKILSELTKQDYAGNTHSLQRGGSTDLLKHEGSSPLSQKPVFKTSKTMNMTFQKHSKALSLGLEDTPSPKSSSGGENYASLIEIDEIEEEINNECCDYENEKDHPKEYDPLLEEFVCHLKEGDIFGELGVETNWPRSNSAVCKTDCEFLVILKKPLELLKMKKTREKEDFLKTIFPFLKVGSISATSFNIILSAFQAEAFSKGSYLTIEGKTTKIDPKFYILFQGECVVEKNLLLESINDKSRPGTPPVPNIQPVQIAIVGKAMLVGEEIILAKDEYSYSVKALSETVIAYSVKRKDFDSKYFQAFNEHILQIYESKKKQRELIFANSKKEYEGRLEQLKEATSSNPPRFQHKNMTKATLQALNRHVSRDQGRTTPSDVFGKNFSDSIKLVPFSSENKMMEDRQSNRQNDSPRGESTSQIPNHLAEMKKALKLLDSDDRRRQNVESRIEFLKKIPNSTKNSPSFDGLDLDELKFFNFKKQTHSRHHNKSSMYGSLDSSINENHGGTSQSKISFELVDVFRKDVARLEKRFRLTQRELTDTKGSPKLQELHSALLGNSKGTDVSRLVSKRNVSEVISPQSSIILTKAQKNSGASNPKVTGIGQMPDKKIFLLDIDNASPLPKKRISISREMVSMSRNASLPELKIADIRLVEMKSQSKERGHSRSNNGLRKLLDIPTSMNKEGEHNEGSIGKTSSGHLYMNNTGDSPLTQIGNVFVQTSGFRLHGNKTVCTNQVINAKDYRSKVFKKVPKFESSRAPVGKIILMNSLNSTPKKE